MTPDLSLDWVNIEVLHGAIIPERKRFRNFFIIIFIKHIFRLHIKFTVIKIFYYIKTTQMFNLNLNMKILFK